MTLIVSLRIPDGIVIAGDSLSTMMGQGQLEAAIGVTCPDCGHQHEIQGKLPTPPVAATTFSYAQKVFPFFGKFGVGTFGTGLLAGKSIYFAMRLIEQRLRCNKTSFKGVTEVAKKIGAEIHNLLKEQLKLENISVDALPPDQFPLGFQVVGYDDTNPKTVEVYVGKKVHYRVQEGLGCTYSGNGEIVQAVWGLYKTQPKSQPPYQVFSLQDAIDYAEFLILTTIAHQRFSQTIPTVGGDIDIALVTPFDGFRWIRQKPLSKVLEGKQDETDSSY